MLMQKKTKQKKQKRKTFLLDTICYNMHEILNGKPFLNFNFKIKMLGVFGIIRALMD